MKKFLIALLFSATFFGVAAEPLIIYIKPDGSTTADGLSWDNAVSLERGRSLVNFNNNLTPAVETQVWAKSGTYNLTTDAFQLTIPITIYGGFAGNETMLSQRNWKLNQTILNQTNPSKAVIFSNVEVNATFDGWIFQNGNRTSAGGCGSLFPGNTLRNCILRNNKTTGAAVLLFTGVAGSSRKITIDNCLIINNECAVSPLVTQITANALVDIINSTFANNYSTATGVGYVVGINTSTGVTLNLINSIIYGNNTADQVATSVASTAATKILYNNAWDVAPGNGTRANNILLTSSPFVDATPFAGISNGTDKLFSAIDTSDFSLKSGSPCINAGNNSYVTAATDLACRTRILDTTVDLGCYEYSINTSTPNVSISGLKVAGSEITLPENSIGRTIRIFNANGMEINNFVANSTVFNLHKKGVFMIKIDNDIFKVLL